MRSTVKKKLYKNLYGVCSRGKKLWWRCCTVILFESIPPKVREGSDCMVSKARLCSLLPRLRSSCSVVSRAMLTSSVCRVLLWTKSEHRVWSEISSSGAPQQKFLCTLTKLWCLPSSAKHQKGLSLWSRFEMVEFWRLVIDTHLAIIQQVLVNLDLPFSDLGLLETHPQEPSLPKPHSELCKESFFSVSKRIQHKRYRFSFRLPVLHDMFSDFGGRDASGVGQVKYVNKNGKITRSGKSRLPGDGIFHLFCLAGTARSSVSCMTYMGVLFFHSYRDLQKAIFIRWRLREMRLSGSRYVLCSSEQELHVLERLEEEIEAILKLLQHSGKVSAAPNSVILDGIWVVILRFRISHGLISHLLHSDDASIQLACQAAIDMLKTKLSVASEESTVGGVFGLRRSQEFCVRLLEVVAKKDSVRKIPAFAASMRNEIRALPPFMGRYAKRIEVIMSALTASAATKPPDANLTVHFF